MFSYTFVFCSVCCVEANQVILVASERMSYLVKKWKLKAILWDVCFISSSCKAIFLQPVSTQLPLIFTTAPMPLSLTPFFIFSFFSIEKRVFLSDLLKVSLLFFFYQNHWKHRLRKVSHPIPPYQKNKSCMYTMFSSKCDSCSLHFFGVFYSRLWLRNEILFQRPNLCFVMETGCLGLFTHLDKILVSHCFNSWYYLS